MLVLHYLTVFSSEFKNRSYNTSSKFYTLSWFHKLPLVRYRFTKFYGTLWILLKIIQPILLYYDIKIPFIILSFLNPFAMFVIDIAFFFCMQKYCRIIIDRPYFYAHLVADFILLVNGIFVLVVETSSQITI